MSFSSLKTLCVDFDGVIHAYSSGWQGNDVIPDGPVPGAMLWLHWAVKRYDVCVYSSRSKDPRGIAAMENAIRLWAHEAELTTDQVSVLVASLSFPAQKPPAWLTIDDRAICFDGNWPDAEQIDNFQPWYKRG